MSQALSLAERVRGIVELSSDSAAVERLHAQAQLEALASIVREMAARDFVLVEKIEDAFKARTRVFLHMAYLSACETASPEKKARLSQCYEMVAAGEEFPVEPLPPLFED